MVSRTILTTKSINPPNNKIPMNRKTIRKTTTKSITRTPKQNTLITRIKLNGTRKIPLRKILIIIKRELKEKRKQTRTIQPKLFF